MATKCGEFPVQNALCNYNTRLHSGIFISINTFIHLKSHTINNIANRCKNIICKQMQNTNITLINRWIYTGSPGTFIKSQNIGNFNPNISVSQQLGRNKCKFTTVKCDRKPRYTATLISASLRLSLRGAFDADNIVCKRVRASVHVSVFLSG